jgi:hypothetical protein
VIREGGSQYQRPRSSRVLQGARQAGALADRRASNSPVVAAEARRGVEVDRLRNQVASIQREIDAGINGTNGSPSPYLAERREWLKAERDQPEAEITALGELTPDELVESPTAVPKATPCQCSQVRQRRGACTHTRTANWSRCGPLATQAEARHPSWEPGRFCGYSYVLMRS